MEKAKRSRLFETIINETKSTHLTDALDIIIATYPNILEIYQTHYIDPKHGIFDYNLLCRIMRRSSHMRMPDHTEIKSIAYFSNQTERYVKLQFRSAFNRFQADKKLNEKLKNK
jgi:hypothetical protein